MDEDSKPEGKDEDEMAKYNLDDYDKESQSIGNTLYAYFNFLPEFWKAYFILASGPFSNIKGLTYYKDNDDDPYITLKEVSKKIVFSWPHTRTSKLIIIIMKGRRSPRERRARNPTKR